LKNFFGSLSHDWVLPVLSSIEVGDPRPDQFDPALVERRAVLEDGSGPSERNRERHTGVGRSAYF